MPCTLIWRRTHHWTQVYFLRWLHSSKMKLHTSSHVTKQVPCCMCTLYTIMWGFWGFWVTTYTCNGWTAFWRSVNTLCALISKLFLFLLAYWTYHSHNPPGQYYSSADRSSEPQQQLHICSSFCVSVATCHKDSSHQVSSRPFTSCVGDLVVQIVSVILIHVILHRNR